MPDSPLRILVILPMYGGSLPIGRYCASALRAMGHSVRVFDASHMHSAFTGLQKLALPPSVTAQLENSFLHVVSQAIWAQIQSVEPQFVLAMAQAPVPRALLQRLKHAGIRTAMWFVEDYRLFTYWQLYAPLYDIFAIIQKEPFVSELEAVGQPHSLYLPLAALPEFHKPLNLTEKEKREYGADIAFLGAGYPNRRLAFHHLAGRDFKIWGSDWEDENLLANNIQRNGMRIDEDESVKIYNATKINLNLHSSLQTNELVSHGDFVNPRTFELASMKAFQLVDERALLGELFALDELAIFTSTEEMYARIDYFLSRPEERLAYVEKAQARVLHEHTYVHRMTALLEYVENEHGAWSKTGKDRASLQDIEPKFQEEFEKLHHTLGLGPNAPFEDIISCLRQQHGKLDDLEAALLFLDEWRKQYASKPH